MDDLSERDPPQKVPSRKRDHFALALMSNLGVMALTFVTGTLTARLLGPAGRGEMSAIQNVATTAGTLALMGLPAAVGFYTSRQPEDARAITVSSLSLSFLFCIPFIIASYALMPALLHSQPPGVVRSARIFLLLLFLQAAIALPLSCL